jgi:hypothetical protein
MLFDKTLFYDNSVQKYYIVIYSMGPFYKIKDFIKIQSFLYHHVFWRISILFFFGSIIQKLGLINKL